MALDALAEGEADGPREDLGGNHSAEVGGALVKRGACLCKLGRVQEALVDLQRAVSARRGVQPRERKRARGAQRARERREQGSAASKGPSSVLPRQLP